ncbi:LuxR C-terminal-related transcriptional regulator [Providencia alcalifaciens]|uniref:LuxR C-terminal-related transcriptional regulator n=1 Tax=Providencia alcalifaciens TaxID=126385 RepID=UPI0002DC2AE9|nr:LuxR C-terminal-related transcriptional regulator [Providencia alcalifaciens]ETT03586.1 transcriptional regulator, LuxR family [Providencia alcalifaciens F90-2004]EUC95182.1 transcriptional regulator, LuxR family [Providencia alcalifaciens PAL-2]EUD03869.1 transcriptional regulator, LuxR family [Providencia alcalifaciens RIMD 1656011]EUD08573.1 transcriptional regulator, LuxR family [Providencia alcalifaciens R90-1475]CAG9412982.1 Transcriptional regulatory protein RcsA [Providencia alcalif
MRILVIDECYYTRLGITEYLSSNRKLKFISTGCIEEGIQYIINYSPSIVLVNLTYYCHYSSYCPVLKALLNSSNSVRFYIYINAAYPLTDKPLLLKDNFFIMSKNIMTQTLDKVIIDSEQIEKITKLANNNDSSIFTIKEQSIINNWMNETPNHIISRKLGISNSTVYSQKRHITSKVFVKNRIELFFIYNVFKYLY